MTDGDGSVGGGWRMAAKTRMVMMMMLMMAVVDGRWRQWW